MLEHLFGSTSRAKILKFFCTHPTARGYVRELARSLDIALNGLSRELENLERMGFVVSSLDQGKKFYSVNPEFPMLVELKALIFKSIVLLEQAIVRDVREMRGVQVFVLTGIFVNEETETDILLVGTIDRQKVQKLITSLSKSFYQDIRFTLFTPAEYKYRLEVTDKFVYTILNHSPIVIINKYAK
jgi:DNA-binding MarR family transcriptional regulator